MAHHAAQTAAAESFAAAPRTAWMSGGLLLLEVPTPKALPGDAQAGPSELLVGGARLMPPVASLALPGATLVLATASAACAAGALVELRRPGHPALQLPLAAPGGVAALLRDRPAPEQTLLLRRLLAAAPAFRARTDPRLGALCHGFAAALASGRARIAAGADGDPVSFWRLPAAAGPDGHPWHLLSPGAPLRSLPAPPPGATHILLDGLPGAGALLVPPAGMPLALDPGGTPPTLLACARGGGARRAALLDALAAAGEAALLRELQLLAPARHAALADPALPVGGALELALSDGEGGLFLRGWLRDPLGLVQAMALRAPGGTLPLPAELLHRLPRPDLAEALRLAPQGDGGPRPGFVAHLTEARLAPGTAQVALELRLRSGQRVTLTAPPGLLPPARARDLVLAAVPAGCTTPALLDAHVAPAVARMQRAAMAETAPPERLHLGPAAPRRPAASVIVPLWRNLAFLRAQLAGFARDPAFRGPCAAELLYVLDSPEQREEAVALLRGLAALHDLPVALLVQGGNRGYAAACNAGAAGAHAGLLVFLNSDVVAEAPGWLGALRRGLSRDRRVAAVGPKLLYPGGAIQHAGLFFAPTAEGEWGCNHYFKGWPADHGPACRARRVPAVTGAALAVRRDAFRAVGGFCTDYVLGDFEDSDLCLALRAAGHEIGYVPSAVLVHHERQSIAAHPGHADTLAAAHNRRLHATRWSGAITALMRRFPHPRG
jgi:GT2 family glycosyltransferase